MEVDLREKKSIKLDVGCGGNKQKNYVGMDKRALEGVDIVHDVESFPWPIEGEIVTDAICSHLIEHIKPWLFIDFMNELWRVMRVGGVVAMQAPYGVNHLFVMDPTHCNPVNHATFQYFDPKYPLWTIYKPKPWRMAVGFPTWQANGLIEILMEKMSEDEVDKKNEEVKANV